MTRDIDRDARTTMIECPVNCVAFRRIGSGWCEHTRPLDRDYREPGQPAGAVTLTASVMGCGCPMTDASDRHEVSCQLLERQ